MNGEPVQQCTTKVRIKFAIHGAQDKVSRKLYLRYRKMEEMLEEGHIQTASAELETALQGEGPTLAEILGLWALQAKIAGMRGQGLTWNIPRAGVTSLVVLAKARSTFKLFKIPTSR